MKRLFILGLIALLAGCGTYTVVPDPGAYSVRDQTMRLKRGTSIALLNGHPQQEMVMVADRMQVDARQVADTAISIMRRHLQRNGVTVDPNAPKKVTIRLASATMSYLAIPFAERWRTTLELEATMGDGRRASARGENNAPAAFRGQLAIQRSLEGAVLFAVTELLDDPELEVYANR